MGYFLTLRVRTSNVSKSLTYVKAHLHDAEFVKQSIQPGEVILPKSVGFFQFDERKNHKFMEKSLNNKLDEYIINDPPFSEADLSEAQYLIFKFGIKYFYFIFQTGCFDTCCIINLIPYNDPLPIIQGDYNIVYSREFGDYYDQEVTVEFR